MGEKKKIGNTKETFCAQVGTNMNRNDMDIKEAEDIRNRWQEYTEKRYKKDLHDPDNHDHVITHLEPDILECEVKWALESITAAHQAPLSLGFSRQEYWSGLPFPSPMHESEKSK